MRHTQSTVPRVTEHYAPLSCRLSLAMCDQNNSLVPPRRHGKLSSVRGTFRSYRPTTLIIALHFNVARDSTLTRRADPASPELT
jgi:hypothetical protein